MKTANTTTTFDELWDVYDRNGNPTGQTILKSRFKSHPEYYRFAVNIWIMNSQGEFLIQQRAATLHHLPLYWSMTGGSIVSGETNLEAIIRETREELGLELAPEECYFFLRSPSSRVWIDTFFAKKDLDLRNLRLNPAEVADAIWAPISHIDHLVANGNFVPARWYFVREFCVSLAQGIDILDLWTDKTL